MDDTPGRERALRARRTPIGLCTFALFACLSAGCDMRNQAAEDNTIAPVALPDFSDAIDEPVRAKIRERHRAVTVLAGDARATKANLSYAYGELGKMFMAAEYRQPAEVSFLNAQRLDPKNRQWPYYLGHLYRDRGDLAKAAASFEAALELQPDDVTTRVWLADV
jgi:tetratricopeptide (TPR) repeat protein